MCIVTFNILLVKKKITNQKVLLIDNLSILVSNMKSTMCHWEVAPLRSQYAVVETGLANSIACNYVVCGFLPKFFKKKKKNPKICCKNELRSRQLRNPGQSFNWVVDLLTCSPSLSTFLRRFVGAAAWRALPACLPAAASPGPPQDGPSLQEVAPPGVSLRLSLTPRSRLRGPHSEIMWFYWFTLSLCWHSFCFKGAKQKENT